jgi:hypothetical protein
MEEDVHGLVGPGFLVVSSNACTVFQGDDGGGGGDSRCQRSGYICRAIPPGVSSTVLLLLSLVVAWRGSWLLMSTITTTTYLGTMRWTEPAHLLYPLRRDNVSTVGIVHPRQVHTHVGGILFGERTASHMYLWPRCVCMYVQP